jgi:hypothetical protein
MPSVMATISSIWASMASMMASAANGGGTKIRLQSAPVAALAVGHGVKNGNLVHFLAALARGDAGHDLRAVRRALARMELAFAAGDALDQDFGILIDENAHIQLR